MAPSHFLRRLLVSGVAILAGAAASAAPPGRTLPMDPVELMAGREAPGKPELSIEYESIEYRFATPESKAAFETDPAKYAVADGGACGRMGPLSGMGDARRYAVHEGRIYFFASDGCRASFLKDPAAHIETDDEKIFGSHQRVVQGQASLDRLVTWAGGPDRIRALKTYRALAARSESQGGKDYHVTNETAIAFPDRYFQKEAWNESWFSTMSGPAGGAMGSTRGQELLAVSRTRAFNRTLARWPVVIMKAYVDGAPQADCPGLIVIGDGEGTLGETPVEYAKVWLNGAASRLTIDKATGQLLQLEFHGRDSTMKVGDSVRSFTAYATQDGVTLPTAYTVTFNGKDLPSAAAKIDSFEVDTDWDTSVFELSK